MNRTVLAFATAPIAVPVIFWLSELAVGGHTELVPGIYFPALLAAYAVELVFGLPGWLLFRHFGIKSKLLYAAGSALIGAFLLLISGGSRDLAPSPFVAAIAALLFRYIAIPDESPQNSATLQRLF